MTLITQALKSKTVLKAVALAIVSVVVAVLTELDMVAYVGIANMIADIFLRSITKEPLSAK